MEINTSIKIVLIVIGIIIGLAARQHYVILIRTENNKHSVKLIFRGLFNLLEFHIPIYPRKRRKEKLDKTYRLIWWIEHNIGKLAIRTHLDDIRDLKRLKKPIKKLDINEFVSDIYFANEEMELTIGVFSVVNALYAFLYEKVKSKKVKLTVTPGFDRNEIKGLIQIDLYSRTIHILRLAMVASKVFNFRIGLIKLKETEGGVEGEQRNKLDKELNGHNA